MLLLAVLCVFLAPVVKGCGLCEMGMTQDHSGHQQQMTQMQQMQQMYQQMQMMGNNQQGMGNQFIQTTTKSPIIPECEDGTADVTFALDASGSIGSAKFQKQLQFVSDVASTFNLRGPNGKTGYQVAVITFENDAKMEFPLNKFQTQRELQEAIKKIAYRGGSTFTDKALKMAKDDSFAIRNGGQINAVKILIVLTDGESTNKAQTEAMAKAIHKKDMMVLAIGVGDQVNFEELKMIASSDQNVYSVKNYDVLDTIKETLQKRTCQVAKEQAITINPNVSYEAYLRWCAEQQVMMKGNEEKNKIWEAMQNHEETIKKHEEEKVVKQKESEKVVNYEHKMKTAIAELDEFSGMAKMMMEMKHKYMFEITSEVVQMCSLGEYKDDVAMFFGHGDSSWKAMEDDKCDVDDMDKVTPNTDPRQVARDSINLPQEKQVEMFFGGLRDSICSGFIGYLDQVKVWSEQNPQFEMYLKGMK